LSNHFTQPAALVQTPAASRVAILGFGTVGAAVARRVAAGEVPGVELTHVLDRRAAEKCHALTSCAWTTRIDDVLAGNADVVVEAIGGIDPAAGWIRAALAAGKSVVTANKQVIAHHGPALLALAARQGRQLRFEAAVGGAMPIVRAVAEGLAGDRLTRIVGVLNGTSNAVLSRMDASGCPIGEALADAQRRGFAEADPSADLHGIDACAKLAILCALAFRVRVDPARIDTRSIGGLGPADFARARRRGATLRQIAFAEYDEPRAVLTAWVAPARVRQSSLFARLQGPGNAAILTGAHGGDTGVFGVGAGGDATAVAVLSDLIAIARDRAAIVPAPVLRAPSAVRGLARGTAIVTLYDTAGPVRRGVPQDAERGRALAEAV
jgi:homoserine dehydrogenase